MLMMLGISGISVLSFRALALQSTKSYKNLTSFCLSWFLIINMLQAAEYCAGYIRPVSSSASILSLSGVRNASLGRMRLGRMCRCLSLLIKSIVWLIFLRVQEYGILPHSRTYYCLLFSLYHMFIVFVISY